jgi:hypothetical protein
MKVGDLVRFKGSDLITGIIMNMESADAPTETGRWHGYVGIMWMDGDRIDFEPKHFLEVISESR